MVERGRGSHLAQVGDVTRQAVNVRHGEVDLRLLGGSQQVKHRVSGTTHGTIQAHGVLEGRLGGDRARQDGGVVVLVVGAGDGHDLASHLGKELTTVGVGSQQGAVHRQGHTQGLGEAVHRVGGKHTRARTAGGASQALDGVNLGVGDRGVGGVHHRVDEVKLAGRPVRGCHLSRLHRATGDEDRRDVQAQGGHEHAGGDLVAVGDAHQGVGAVGLDHVLHRVSDEVTTGQGVEHAVMAHGDAVIHGDGVELLGDTAAGLDLLGHNLADVAQAHVTGDELGEGVGDRDNRLAEVGVLDAGGAPQGAGTSHIPSGGGSGAAIARHECS